MPAISITDPESNTTIGHTFPATGAYAIDDNDTGKGNIVRSVVTHGSDSLDTQIFRVPPGTTGTWSVNHQVSGTTTLTDCVVTATLVISGSDQASAAATGITIEE